MDEFNGNSRDVSTGLRIGEWVAVYSSRDLNNKLEIRIIAHVNAKVPGNFINLDHKYIGLSTKDGSCRYFTINKSIFVKHRMIDILFA